MNDLEPTLKALRNAVEQLRSANHHAYNAPALPGDLYARAGELAEILSHLRQVAFTLGNHVERSGEDARKEQAVLDSDDDVAGSVHVQEARRLLADSAAAIETANKRANDAWSALSHLKLTDAR